jgi:hypothetical protein
MIAGFDVPESRLRGLDVEHSTVSTSTIGGDASRAGGVKTSPGRFGHCEGAPRSADRKLGLLSATLPLPTWSIVARSAIILIDARERHRRV